jgi:hypothetical protein
MVYNKADFKKHIESIQIDGFKLKSAVQAYLFIRKLDDRTETITLSYRNYAPHGFYISGVSVDIHFNKVESVLEKFKNTYFPNNNFGHSTIHKSFVNLQGIDYSKFEIEIKDDYSFNEVAKEVKQIVEIGALLFFEKFNSLMTVFIITETMEIDEMADFIVQPLPQRRIVLKKICQDINYREYVNIVVEFYKSENNLTWLEIEKLDFFLKTIQSA